MHKADVEINSSWQNLATVISTAISDTFTFDSDKKYSIQVKSDVPVTICNSSAEPTADEGIVLNYSDQIILKVATGNLYAKCSGEKAILNICEMEED